MQVPLGDTYYFSFTTRAFATGIPTTLAGTPVISVKEEANDTVITSGVTLDVDTVTGGVTGLHEVAIVASSGNGYEVGKYYTAYISTGTVGGVSVVGEAIGHFRVMAAEGVAGVPDVNTTHVSDTVQTANDNGADINNILLDTAEIGTAGAGLTNIGTIATVTNLTNLPTIPANWITAAGIAADAIGASELAADAVTEIQSGLATSSALATAQTDLDTITGAAGVIIDDSAANDTTISDAVWDETLTGTNHNDPNSAGRRLRQVDQAFIITEGTAQAATGTTITLAAGESAVDDIFRGDRIQIIAGTGVGEHEIILSYVGSTKVATVADTWVTTPDATSEYILVPASVDVESIQHIVQTGGDLAALITTVDTVVDGIQTDLDNGTDGLGAIKTDTAAVKTVTDQMVFTKANELDVNTQSINGATVVGDGNATPWDGA